MFVQMIFGEVASPYMVYLYLLLLPSISYLIYVQRFTAVHITYTNKQWTCLHHRSDTVCLVKISEQSPVRRKIAMTNPPKKGVLKSPSIIIIMHHHHASPPCIATMHHHHASPPCIATMHHHHPSPSPPPPPPPQPPPPPAAASSSSSPSSSSY